LKTYSLEGRAGLELPKVMIPGSKLQDLVPRRYDPKKIAILRHGRSHRKYSAPQMATCPILPRQRKETIDGDSRMAEALNAEYWISALPGSTVYLPDGTRVDTAVILDIYHADSHREPFTDPKSDYKGQYIEYKLTPVHQDHGLRQLIGKTISWSPLPAIRWADLVSSSDFCELGEANEPIG